MLRVEGVERSTYKLRESLTEKYAVGDRSFERKKL